MQDASIALACVQIKQSMYNLNMKGLHSIEIPPEDLPVWMRLARQNVDWGVLFVLMIGILVSWPFVLQDGLPHTNASENYVYMTANYAEDMIDGRFYPRWTATAANGYGAPIPNYYPPGVPYAGALLQVLFFDDPVVAVRILYVLVNCLLAGSTYAFLMRWLGSERAVFATTLFVLSPYVGLTLPHALGDLRTLSGLAMLTTLVWATSRLLARNLPLDVLHVAASLAGLILVDVWMLPAALFIVMGFVLWRCSTDWQGRRVAWFALSMVLGIGLSAFFWLPAWGEQQLVRWAEPLYPRFDVELQLTDLIAPLHRIDLNALLLKPQWTLGLFLPIMALLGLLTGIVRSTERGFWIYCGITGMGMLAALLWFPHQTRLLGPLSLICAICSGNVLSLLNAEQIMPRRARLSIALVFVFSVSAGVWLAPRWPPVFGDTGAPTQLAYAQQGFGTAVLPSDDAVPMTVNDDLEPNNTLLLSYQTGNPLRLPQNQLTVDRQASQLRSGISFDEYLISTTYATSFKLLRAYFPGWQARLSGSRAILSVDQETGLMDVFVATTNREVLTISLEPTELRRNAWTLTWIALVLLILLVFFRLRGTSNRIVYDDVTLLLPDDTRLIIITGIGFAVAIGLFAMEQSPYSLHDRPGYRLDNSIEVRSLTGAGIELISFRLDDTELAPDDTAEITVYWRTIRPLVANYSVRVSLRDMQTGLVWGIPLVRVPGDYPTRRWQPGRYVEDVYQLQIPESVNEGEYHIALELLDCRSNCNAAVRVDFFERSGALVGPVFEIPQVIRISRAG